MDDEREAVTQENGTGGGGLLFLAPYHFPDVAFQKQLRSLT